MTLSLGEVEALARKAARGAGHSWGMADEAAMAIRWLCARDQDGCQALANLLTRCDGVELKAWVPVIDGKTWAAPGGMLCPLLAGAALSDRAGELARTPVRLGPVAEPVILLPFAARAAQQLCTPVSVHLSGITAITDGDALGLVATTKPVDRITIRTGGKITQGPPPQTRADPDPRDVATLSALAHRTYAPATEASRRSGAGAGLSDND